MSAGKILLSFDVEEFDLPKEHGADITLEQGIKVSKAGLLDILNILEAAHVKATFFCTGNFAKHQPALIKMIHQSGHEIACHGVDHFSPQPSDIIKAKNILETIINDAVYGYRQPRMQPINYSAMYRYGYIYDSSINPTFLPGRYNHFRVPRHPYHIKSGIIEIPTSVATPLRIPLFWLALHLFPFPLYFYLVKRSIKKSGYFTTYFHPWEFTNLALYPAIPKYIQHNSGAKLSARLKKLITKLQAAGYTFHTYSEYLQALPQLPAKPSK